MSLTKLSLEGNNLTIFLARESWLVTSRLGTVKSLAFFTVYPFYMAPPVVYPHPRNPWQRVLAIGFQLILSNIFYHPSVYPCID